MTRGNYRASGKLARTDWTPEMDRDLLSVKFTPTQKRVHGRGPDAFSDVAKKYGKTLAACHMRFNRVRRKSGLDWCLGDRGTLGGLGR